jgi:dipeptidyl aminopeptidase/acylaminoacyl peptidase
MEFSLAAVAWSRDSTKVLANAYPVGLEVEAVSEEEVAKRGGTSIWELAVISGTWHKLRQMAWGDSYSPNGSLISFNANRGRNGPREIWLMDSDGGHPRKILDGGNLYGIDSFTWSPDGRRVSYIRHNTSTFEEVKLAWETDHVGKELSRIQVKNLFGAREVYDGVELPGGQSPKRHGADLPG